MNWFPLQKPVDGAGNSEIAMGPSRSGGIDTSAIRRRWADLDDKTVAWMYRIALSLTPPPILLVVFSPITRVSPFIAGTNLLTAYVFLGVVLGAENLIRYSPIGEILVPGKTYQSLLLFVMAVILWAGIFVVATSPLLEISPILAVAAVGWASLIYRVNLRNSRWEWDRRIKDNEELQRLRIAAGKDEVNIGGVKVDISDKQ